jgi:oxalate decarboxylase/phosphoglucose isomerase-like protein (cupin superfamily)
MKSDKPVVLQVEDCAVSGGSDYGTALSWRTILDKSLSPSSGMTAGVIDMLPGALGKLHWHAQPEIYYVLSGTGEVEIQGAKHLLKPNTVVFIPGNAPHALTNTGTNSLKIFYVFAADSMADITYVFQDGAQKVLR